MDTNTAVLMKVPQVARVLNMSEPTVWRRIRDGSLPAVHIGNCTRIHRDTVQEIIDQAKAPPTAA